MNNKNLYMQFAQKNYVPLYSKAWWMDAVCLPENWNVWLYEKEGEICAVVPYYIEMRRTHKYITKASLTQNNGIIFKIDKRTERRTNAKFQEQIIDVANMFIESLNFDVYEHQYHYSFNNWLPFLGHQYMAITKYKYVIENTSNIEAKDNNDIVLSILFLTWDEQSVSHLLGGIMPEYQHLQTWERIKTASQMGLTYDFEGSMIKKISKSMRKFGGEPKPYFEIRKVFNSDIIRAETEKQIISEEELGGYHERGYLMHYIRYVA